KLEAAGIAAFGPSEAAAQLEASKGFTKDLAAAAKIPTAAYKRFTEAEAAIDDALTDGKFGKAGAEIVVEEFLEGPEASFLALVDGANVLPLVSAQDHKRVGDGDTGPNTGGMGAISPAPGFTPEIERAALDRIVKPTVAAMAARGMPFKGVLYAGLILTRDGPKLI